MADTQIQTGATAATSSSTATLPGARAVDVVDGRAVTHEVRVAADVLSQQMRGDLYATVAPVAAVAAVALLLLNTRRVFKKAAAGAARSANARAVAGGQPNTTDEPSHAK